MFSVAVEYPDGQSIRVAEICGGYGRADKIFRIIAEETSEVVSLNYSDRGSIAQTIALHEPKKCWRCGHSSFRKDCYGNVRCKNCGTMQ